MSAATGAASASAGSCCSSSSICASSIFASDFERGGDVGGLLPDLRHERVTLRVERPHGRMVGPQPGASTAICPSSVTCCVSIWPITTLSRICGERGGGDAGIEALADGLSVPQREITPLHRGRDLRFVGCARAASGDAPAAGVALASSSAASVSRRDTRRASIRSCSALAAGVPLTVTAAGAGGVLPNGWNTTSAPNAAAAVAAAIRRARSVPPMSLTH